MDDRTFNAHRDKEKPWFQVLGLKSLPASCSKNTIKSVSTLRKLFQDYTFLTDTGSAFARSLGAHGKVVCRACYLTNKKSGTMQAIRDTVSRHATDGPHTRNMEKHDRAQQRLTEMTTGIGGASHDMEYKRGLVALAVGKLTAGGNGAAGIPPSSLAIWSTWIALTGAI